MIQLWTLCFFAVWAVISNTEKIDAPPAAMPPAMRSAYTMNNKISVSHFYVDDTLMGKGTHFKYSSEIISSYVNSYRQKLSRWRTFAEKENLDNDAASLNDIVMSLDKMHWPLIALDAAFKQNGLHGKKVVVFGTQEPWAEAICLALGSLNITTVEYNNLTLESPALRTLKPAEFRRLVLEDGERYDVALSFSSFDHDGLGRYGDPLSPDGDIEAVRLMHTSLAATGIAFLTLPIGQDLIVWNLHRRYGALRLPLILDGWTILKRIGWNESQIYADNDFRRSYEPVLLLQPISPEINTQQSKRNGMCPSTTATPEKKSEHAGTS